METTITLVTGTLPVAGVTVEGAERAGVSPTAVVGYCLCSLRRRPFGTGSAALRPLTRTRNDHFEIVSMFEIDSATIQGGEIRARLSPTPAASIRPLG